MELLTPKEVRLILKCSLPYVYKLAERDLLSCVRIPTIGNDKRSMVRFKKEDVFEFIKKKYHIRPLDCESNDLLVNALLIKV